MVAEPSLVELIGRIERLEKHNRQINRLAAAALLCAGALLLMGQTASKKIVEANEFVLRDNSGNARARLSMSEIGPEMVLLDETGGTRVRLRGSTLLGGEVSVFNRQGEPRGLLSAFFDQGHVSLLDSKGKTRTTVSPGIIWVDGGVMLEDDKGFAA